MDPLAEIDGVKPLVLLAVNDERQIKGSGKNPYTIKRADDHYYCTCPAWRNQKGVATDARTCKHIKSLLGEAYEEARLRMKAGGSGASAAAAKPTSKAAAGSKRKKPDDDGEEAKPAKPAKRGRKPVAESETQPSKDEEEPAAKRPRRAAPASKGKAKAKVEEDEMDVDEEAPAATADTVDDPSVEVNGVKPLVSMADGEEREVKSEKSKSVYKVKRTLGHYYCTCPAWRNQSRVKVEVRTCKHLKSLLGEEFEEARTQVQPSDDTVTKPASKSAKPASKSAKPASTAKNSDKKPSSTRSTRSSAKKAEEATAREETIEEAMDEDAAEKDDDADAKPAVPSSDEDELAEIDGIKPDFYMKDGDETEAKSQSSNTTYKVKRTWDHYYCTCPAWRNQGGVPVNARSCKHLKSLLGEKYEAARIKLKNPDGAAASSTGTKKPASRRTADKKNVPKLLLANKWELDGGPDPTGWWISEKLDGVRTYYDGKGMLSRLGNPFTPPKSVLDKLPKDITLDGELFGGRKNFQDTVSIVKTMNSPHWQNITYQVFDIPSSGDEPFEDRMEKLKALFGPEGTHACKEIVLVEHVEAKDRDHVLEKLKEVEALGGEGLMLRKPQSKYEGHRSSSLLKIKTFHDAEAEVTGYVAGKGKHTGSTGALKCKMASGKTFNVGTGLSDKQRKNPPKIGTIITYRFQELTRDLVPRFPSFVGEAIDKTEPKDADIAQIQKAADPEDDEDAEADH